MAAGPGPPPAEEEEAAAAAAAEAAAASRSAGHELGHCGRCPRARKRPLESGCSRRLVTHSRQLAETQHIPEPPSPEICLSRTTNIAETGLELLILRPPASPQILD